MRAARAGTRVLAPLIDAGQVARALGVDRTLGPTIGGPSDVAFDARASGCVTDNPTDAVGSAG